MRFAFRLESGVDIMLHARTGKAAVEKLRTMTQPGFAVLFVLHDVILCGISQDDYEYSHSNDEMVDAGQEIVDHFWEKLHHGIDAEVRMEEHN